MQDKDQRIWELEKIIEIQVSRIRNYNTEVLAKADRITALEAGIGKAKSEGFRDAVLLITQRLNQAGMFPAVNLIDDIFEPEQSAALLKEGKGNAGQPNLVDLHSKSE